MNPNADNPAKGLVKIDSTAKHVYKQVLRLF